MQTVRFAQLQRETHKAYRFDGVWVPKSVAKSVEQIDENDWRVRLPQWFIKKCNLHNRVIDPDSRAAYDHWNEEADYRYAASHPEIFGRN